MTWMGNYEPRTAKFVPHDGKDQVVWPARAFAPDSSGGTGVPSVTGARHDVLARENPPWAAALLEAAVAAGRPLIARRVGSAGKYRFWRLAGETQAEAQRLSDAAAAAAQASQAAAEAVRLAKEYEAARVLVAGHRLVTVSGQTLHAQRCRLGDGERSPTVWWDSTGARHETDEVCARLDDAGIEHLQRVPNQPCMATWLPGGHPERAVHADAIAWTFLLVLAEARP